jgi:hypothetical protein
LDRRNWLKKMTVFLVLALVFVVGLCIAALFLRADPAKLASSLKYLLPVPLALCGIAIMAIGGSGVGAFLFIGAMAWYGAMTMEDKPQQPVKEKRQRSMVRTAALEMELDHATGGLEGLVLAGRHDGKMLGSLGLAELRQLLREISSDAESRHLLEAYLDSRFPIWRGHAEADADRGLSVAPGTGAMTKEEAYKVLGLEAGAAAADVRKAHRRLMKRLQPDVGSTSFLAARINEAKDVLLSDHD